MKNGKIVVFIPILIAFFSMGFVDIVGTASNNIKADFGLSDSLAGLLPFMVFVWFLVFSIPTSLLMNKIGRRKTVIISLIVTLLAMVTPLVGYNLPTMLVSFALLGIGNALMQVSLNPLLTNVISGDKLASGLTLGQFFKAIASFLGPVIAGWVFVQYGDWKLIFPIFAAVSIIPIVWLSMTRIEEVPVVGKASTFMDCFGLLRNSVIALLFIGILVHVGIDVGLNLTIPKILMERIGQNVKDANYAISIYFFFRTIGCFSGAFIMTKLSSATFFKISVALLVIGISGLLVFHTLELIYVCVALLGLGNSNIFPIIFSHAMKLLPARNNEISGLMITGIAGGAIFPFFMGIASDGLGSQIGAVIVLALCAAYLVFLSGKVKFSN